MLCALPTSLTNSIVPNRLKITPNLFTFLASIYYIGLGFVFIKINPLIDRLRNEGKIASVSHISLVVNGFLSLGGLAVILPNSPDGTTYYHWGIIVVSIVLGVFLTHKYESKNEIKKK